MGTEEMSLVPTTTNTQQRHDNGGPLNPSPHQLIFHHDDSATVLHRFPPLHHHSGDPGPKTTRELTAGFIDDHNRFFQSQPPPDFRRPFYAASVHSWNVNGRPTGGDGGDGSDGDGDDDDDDDEDDEEIDDGDGELKINNNSSNTNGNSSDKIDKNGRPIHMSCFGSSRELILKEGNVVAPGDDDRNNDDNNNNNNVRTSSCENQASQFQNAGVTIAVPHGDLYYSHQYLQGPEGSNGLVHKDVSLVENGCGFSGRKDVLYTSESGESLRRILSDPLTGSLMDDAMILPCGHSFGGGGMQHVIRMKACYTCSQPVSEDSVATNLSLRAAVQAFRREEELQLYRSSKRRREKFEQDKSGYGDVALMDHPRGKGVQFPFVVTDRVIIKGNKRTPQRFVGREAVVTTQCLNGWSAFNTVIQSLFYMYVVKTLDNAESVKLQYRSLAKVPDNANPITKPASSKMIPNWL